MSEQQTNGANGHVTPDSWKLTLKSKVIAISGANQGIGLALAEVCLQNDASHVYSLDIGEPSEPFNALAKQFPGRLSALKVDITDAENVTSCLEKIVTECGKLDGLIANAGITKHKPALEFTRDEINRLFDINTVPSAPYGATKAALRSIAKTLAMEWAEHGIRVNTVSPGFILTQMSEHIKNAPDWKDKMKYWRGMPRLALPQELGGAYTYLLSDVSSYTTGIDIPVAGSIGAW